ncbi:Methyltransferase small, partial [Monoraphidium neglectum]
DSFALVDALLQQLPGIVKAGSPRVVLEVGCGSGYVICSAAIALRQAAAAADRTPGSSFLAVDISAPALAATARTLAAHEVSGVDLVRSDLLGPLSTRLQGCIDLLLFNPPYVPTPDEEVERDGIARAWAGGYRGRRVIDRVLPLLPDLLAPGGHFFMVTVLENEPEGAVVLQRGADEECLKILHLRKDAGAG